LNNQKNLDKYKNRLNTQPYSDVSNFSQNLEKPFKAGNILKNTDNNQ